MKLFVILMALGLSGCLTTRSQLKEQEQQVQLKTEVQTLQQTKADAEVRFQELEGQLRSMNGRLETVENHLVNANSRDGKALEEQKLDKELLENKFKLIQEALLKVETELNRLEAKIDAVSLKASSKSDKDGDKDKDSSSGNYTQAEKDFAGKRWKEAIVNYQKYRDLNPKGKKYVDATYNIGVCFEELGMKNAAKGFFEEVVEKFPSSHFSKKAQNRLKNMK